MNEASVEEVVIMSQLKPQETQIVAEMAAALYNFLPGTSHPMSRIKADFGTVAEAVGLGNLWPGGSKQPAIEALLESTLQMRRDRFCSLLVRIVREGLKYRTKKGNPITQEEMGRLNMLIAKIGFRIPELVDPNFIASLPQEKPTTTGAKKETTTCSIITREKLSELKTRFLQVSQLKPQERGYALEKFLYDLFDIYGFNPRPSFRIVGEQIDGSIEFEHEFYLIEAKWQMQPIDQADILVLDGRVAGHSGIGRGIYITAGCFSPDGIAAYNRLRPSSIIGIDGQDLYFILEHALPLDGVLRRKIRWLVETGDFYYPVSEFLYKLDGMQK